MSVFLENNPSCFGEANKRLMLSTVEVDILDLEPLEEGG